MDRDSILYDFGESDSIGEGDVPALLEIVAIVCAVLQTTYKGKGSKLVPNECFCGLIFVNSLSIHTFRELIQHLVTAVQPMLDAVFKVVVVRNCVSMLA